MTNYLHTVPLDPSTATFKDRAFKLSLYIGQFKVPVFKSATDGSCSDTALTIRVRSGVSITKDAFGCLVDNGNGGVAKDGAAGLVVTAPPVNHAASLGASQDSGSSGGVSNLAYNMSYQSVAGYFGGDSFTLQVVNPAGMASKTVPVTVYGVTSGSTATGLSGQAYTAAAPLYAITSNDGSATFSASLVSPVAALSTLGLSVDASGKVVGTVTGAPGTYTMRVVTNISDSTVGVGNGGAVTKDVTVTIVGITSSATANYIQGQAIAPYQVTTSPSATAGSYTVSPSPIGNTLPGLAFNTSTGQLTGTPTSSGSFQVTIGATTSGPALVVTKQLTITVASAGAPVIGTTPALPVSPLVAGVAGTPFANTQINASNLPITVGSYTATGLPAGLGVNVNTGQITGTPTVSGDFPVTLGASNSSGAGSQSLTIRINPSTVPTITSANAAFANVGSAFVGYQITASNGPITSYAVVAPSVLPSGLSLDAITGLITGTPLISGSFNVNISASNASGASAPLLLAFTVSPNTVPAITGPTFASFTAGTAIAPVQIVATNPAILSYSATGLPPGLVLDTSSGLISGTPITPGSYSATLSATNAMGAGSRTVAFTIGVPAPVACTMSVPLNTAATLDLSTCLFNGFAPTGASIVATPAHGAAQISGTRVTYTPVHNYFGTDAFSFVGHGAGGNSPQGVVSVTITGRPDPTQDAVVTALVAAQTETAQRFSRAQMSNFQRRMEALHRAPAAAAEQASTVQGPSAGSGSGFAAAASLSASATVPASTRVAALGANGAAGQFGGAGSVFGPGPAATTTGSAAQAVDAIASGLGIKSLPFSDSV
ncbi:MAG: putative Ig domain-containing protein, partial [Burkholderiaceae bacterium]